MRLVLTLADFLKETLERQALKRMDRGTVTDDQIAAMSEAFAKMDAKISALCAEQGFDRQSLDIQLGPFASLMGRAPPKGESCRRAGRHFHSIELRYDFFDAG